MTLPDIEKNIGKGEGEWKPRPPTLQEIAQAIYDHVIEASGSEPASVAGAFEELHNEDGKSSTVRYIGPIGTGEFKFQWPTGLPVEEK